MLLHGKRERVRLIYVELDELFCLALIPEFVSKIDRKQRKDNNNNQFKSPNFMPLYRLYTKLLRLKIGNPNN